MKNIIKIILLLSFTIVFVIFGELFLKTYVPDFILMKGTSELMTYGGIAGYILFIVFVVLLQEEGYYQLKQINPKSSKIIHQMYILVSVIFIALIFMDFTMYLAIILASSFMMVTSFLDMLRDKIINKETKVLYPKKTI